MAPGNRRISITISARNQASRAFRQLQADIQKTNTAATNLNKTTAAGSRTVDRLSSSLQRGSRSANTYAGTISNVHGQVIALSIAQRGLNDALNATAISQARAAINLERLQVALKTISGSTAAATAQYERLVDVARLPGINLENSLRASTQLQAIGKSGVEATEIIRQFGNALALSSQSPRELRQTIRGLSQLSTVGSLLQEDLEIITSRISVLNRGLKELGGPRAEGISKFYDALGVPPDQQGPRLVEDMLNILRELPRAGNTAANAIENLFDTTERAQATIGRNFLPIIRESTSALEKLAARIEKNPELARTIALFETFAGTLGTVALAIAGVGVALTFLGPALIATFTNPIGLAALAVGALAAAVLTWKVANESAQQPLQDLNPLIKQNTELIERNRRAKEENNRSELQATGQSLQDAIGQIQRRIEVIRQAGAEAQEVLARLDDRLQNLQGSRGRQTSQLAARVEEEFDAAFIATRGLSEELTKAEAELQRLTETAEATDAITDGFQEADQAAENLRKTINKLGKEISEGASTDNLRASLSGQNVDPKTLLGDLVVVQSSLNRVSETYDEIASNAGDSEAAQTQLAEIQGVLTGATERYLDALSQSLALTLADTDAKESDFEEIQRLAQGYTDYYQGRGDAFQAYVDRAEGLAERAVAAIGQLDLAERAEDAQKEAARVLAEAERQQIAAVKAVIAEEEAAYKQRIAFTRRQQTETTQAYRTSDRIQRDLLTERTNAEEESAENAIDAVNERAEASEAAAGRVTDRWLDAIDKRERAEERADRDAARREQQAERREQQAERRRERQAEREERELSRRNQRIARSLGATLSEGIFDGLDSDLISGGIEAAFGDPVNFGLTWADGFINAVLDTFEDKNPDLAAALNPEQNDEVQRARDFEALGLLADVLPGITSEVGEFPAENQVLPRLQSLGVGPEILQAFQEALPSLSDSLVNRLNRNLEGRLPPEPERDDLGLARTIDQFDPDFHDEPGTPREQLDSNLLDLGFSQEQVDQLAQATDLATDDEVRAAVERSNQLISEGNKESEKAARDAERDAKKRENELSKSNVNLSSALALDRESQDTLRQLLREDEDSPLQDILDNRQGLLRLFSAEKIDAFLVGANDLIESQKELADEQLLAQEAPEELEFLRNLELLLREAGPIDPEAISGVEGLQDVAGQPEGSIERFIARIREALVADLQGVPLPEEERADLVSDLEQVFESLNILPETADAFVQQLETALTNATFRLDPEAQASLESIEISTEEAAAYLKSLEEFLREAGVPEDRIQEVVGSFSKAFADGIIDFQENTDLFKQLNDTLAEFDIGQISLDGLTESLRTGFEAVTLGIDPDATVGLDPAAEAKLEDGAEAKLEDGAEAKLEDGAEADLADDAEAKLEDGAEAKLEDGAEVDVNTEGKTVPVGELPEGTKVPIDALPPGTTVPIEDLPEDVKILFAGVPDGTLIPIEDLPPGTLIPIEALSPDIEIPFGGIAEGTVVPFGGVPEGTLIAVEDTADREIAVEDTSGRTIQVEVIVPTTETPQVPQTEQGQATTERAEAGRPRPPDESDVMHGFFTTPFETGGSLIAQGLSEIAIATEMPVNLSEGSSKSIASSIADQTLKVNPAGDTMPVSGDVNAEVKGTVGIDGIAQVQGDVSAAVRGTVAVGNTVNVRIVDVSQFIQDLADQVSENITLGGVGIPSHDLT